MIAYHGLIWRLFFYCFLILPIPSGFLEYSQGVLPPASDVNQSEVFHTTKYQLTIKTDQAMTLNFNPWEIITALAWSNDGKYILISAGNGIYIFDADTLRQLARIEMGSFSRTLKFSHSGDLFVAGSRDGHIRVWNFKPPINNDPGDHSLFLRIDVPAHKNGVNEILFNSQDTSLISAGNDGLIKIWDIASGKIRSTIIGGNRSISGVASSPRSNNIAILNGDFIRIRDFETTLITGTFLAPEYLFDISYSLDGKTLISSSVSNDIYLWDADSAYRSGVERYPEPYILTGHKGKSGTYQAIVWDIEIHPSGGFIASAGGDGQLIFWNLDTKQPFQVDFNGGIAITCIAFSPDGNKIMAGMINGVVEIWALSDLIEESS